MALEAVGAAVMGLKKRVKEKILVGDSFMAVI